MNTSHPLLALIATLHRSIPVCVFLAAALTLTGCNGSEPETGGNPTGPSGGSGSNADVSGTYAFRSSGGSASTFSSSSSSVTSTLVLTQNGGTLGGSHTNTVRSSNTCNSIAGLCLPFVETMPGGPLKGTVSGQSVVLEFNTDDDPELERYEGTLSGDRIAGNGWSATRVDTAPPPAVTAPAAPTNLTATVDAQALEVFIHWSDNSADEDGFAIAKRCDGETEWTLLALANPESTGVNITGFASGQSCQFMVFAFKEDGDSVVLSDPTNAVTVNIP